MIQYLQKNSSSSRFHCKGGAILLAFLWLLGSICGLYFVSIAGDQLQPMVASLCESRLSLFGLSTVIFIPIIISAIAFYFSAPAIVYIFSVVKSFTFACCIFGITITFGYSAWLIRTLLLFTDSCVVIIMLWLWYRMLKADRLLFPRDLIICSVASTVIGFIDYFLVSPYLEMLVNYS